MLVIAMVIARSLRPMVCLADELDARKGGDMGQLDMLGAPSELHPFLVSINGLLGRIRSMMEQQRHFVADAAHELRTPITALSLQAENLDALEMSTEARDRLEILKGGMRRTKHMLEQLLALARQDSTISEDGETVDLAKLAKDVVGDLLPQAATQNIDLGFTMAEPVAVHGNSFAIASAIRNLIDNAVKFTPDGGRVDVGGLP
ncbi:histidine kinase dimerization/phospho-acceptor domain-containing protein [Bradyrhizobium sp. SSUT112]|uniref:histidine kinase dimerization/phospho-acceptor domain-containing protein n=1 Tax=Bradyrhizobium sp. SSUT112 TaxID=3040604 RepID=UPI002449EB7F|nr:histidine kinase dimerization/phospho-acceptor domain-containing protein [Bradyrhizobium sp. SSUT112]MDH2350539.1 histidine kinase dimerization/phospho-acceptor domain-containing protein [Bradyrhizobium sp. SSUT112]